ncbi:hypothetical protein LTR56_007532 [Elasticomyces elasticus]|nr:hypothetical protein LTR56_007532 [Elasticomyces elasticus]KAK3668146.1 hypothetical protein LTR22_000831 [Elasticomyces elasticus]KAK4906648.1 hypothetical protein LTR49_024217 [Elasticomyces elasticus]KAK5769527.1 hypothetical protein LTS12_000454 [Elasticomyces elasticus]
MASEADLQEAQQGIITLEEDNPLVIAAMLSYMYTCDYSEEVKVDGMEDMMPILFNVHVHVLADKYDMPDLAEMAAKKFKERAEKEWKDASFADAAALVFMAGLPTAPLREVVVAIAVAHAGELNKDMVDLHFHKVASSIPALGLALWRKQSAVTVHASGLQLCECAFRHCTTRMYVDLSLEKEAPVWCSGCKRTNTVREWTQYKV